VRGWHHFAALREMNEHSTTSDAQPPSSAETASVLSGLPRRRPGRRTERRESAQASVKRSNGTATRKGRAATSTTASKSARGTTSARGKPSGASKRSPRARTGTRKSSAARTPAARLPLPPQGFETEDEARIGKTVEPPSRFELATSLVELAGEGVEELVKASLSAGGSLIKRTLDLIPKP